MPRTSHPLPAREGTKPSTTRPTPDRRFPHSQVDQTAPVEFQDEIVRRAAALPGVSVGPSAVSVKGARAFHLAPELARGPEAAFQRKTEFAHVHPAHDGSLHLTLPPGLYQEVMDRGWGEPHPVSGTMMAFGPRSADELEVVWRLVEASYRYALGQGDDE